MTTTLHPPVGAGPQALAQMTRDLHVLADGETRRVRSGRGGLVVDDDLALAYLSTRPGARRYDLLPPGAPVPGGSARLVRQAEQRAGLAGPTDGEHKPREAEPAATTPDPAAVPAPAPKTAARRRRVAARPPEEQA